MVYAYISIIRKRTITQHRCGHNLYIAIKSIVYQGSGIALWRSVLSCCWRYEHHILTNNRAGNLGQWLGAMTHEDAGWPARWGVLPHFAEDDPSPEALERDRLVMQWKT